MKSEMQKLRFYLVEQTCKPCESKSNSSTAMLVTTKDKTRFIYDWIGFPYKRPKLES